MILYDYVLNIRELLKDIQPRAVFYASFFQMKIKHIAMQAVPS